MPRRRYWSWSQKELGRAASPTTSLPDHGFAAWAIHSRRGLHLIYATPKRYLTNEIENIEIAMSAQMSDQAVPFSLRATEINQQQPTVRLEDTQVPCERMLQFFVDTFPTALTWCLEKGRNWRLQRSTTCSEFVDPRHRTGNRREPPLTRTKPSALCRRKLKQARQLTQGLCAPLDLGCSASDGLVERQMFSQYL